MFAPKVAKPQAKETAHARHGLARQSARLDPYLSGQGAVAQALMLQRTIGNQATSRLLAQRSSPPRVQAKLTVGTIDDPLECEADAVADHVMRMPGPALPISPAGPQVSRKCAACDEKARAPQAKPAELPAELEEPCESCADEAADGTRDGTPPQIRRLANGTGGVGAVASDFTRGLGAGAPLDAGSRSFFEPRFGYDFGAVRIHQGARADTAAASINARAFTLGRDIVFAADAFDPGSAGGRRLLAHELTHVVQQSGPRGPQADERRGLSPLSSAPSHVLQRKCHASELGAPSPDCTPSQDGVGGWQFLFKVGCDELLPGEEEKINKLKAGNQLKIHGFASKEGDESFNSDLSCHRANRIAEMARKLRADCPIIGIFKHGASPVSGPGLVKDVHPPAFWRNVVIEEVKPPFESGEMGLDPNRTIHFVQALLDRAKVNPTQPNLLLISAWRSELRDWLTGIGKTLAPAGAQLTQRNLDDYRRFYSRAEDLWQAIDQVLAQQKFPDADKDTYKAWAVGPGKDQGDKLHAKDVPTGAKYHVDLFGEGYFKGAINVGAAERTSTTGIQDSRVPYLIYRRFSGKDANALPFADHTVDLITEENGPIGYPGLAEEIARIIAPGGTIVLYNPDNQEPAHDKVAKAVGGKVTKVKKDGILQTTIVAPP